MENKYTEDYHFQSLVQSVLTGGLTEKEKVELADILNQDIAAQAEYTFSEGLTKTLKHQDLFVVAGIVKQVIDAEGLPDMDTDTEISPNPPPQYSKISYFKNWFWVSLSVLFVGLSLWGVWQYRQTAEAKHNKQMAQEYLKPLEINLFTTTQRQGIQNLTEGMKAYEAQDYASASNFLRKYYSQTKDVNAGLYLTISILLSQGAPQEAEQVLTETMSQQPEPVKEVAEWYLILTKLTANKKEEALLMLKKLPASHIYKKEAEKLLQQIELN